MTNQNFLNSNYTTQLQLQSEVFDQSQSVFFNLCFDKNQLKKLIAWFLENYGEKITVDFLETLKQVGFHQATLAGVSLGVDDLQIPAQKSRLLSQALVKIGELTNAQKTGNITGVEKSQRLIDTWNQTSELLRQTAVQNFRLTNPVNPVFMMAFSGARGNISQVRQLVAMRGLMADPQGAILEFPIQSNFREGLTITEYLISCYGARKGLVDTALRTATSGYLTRRLVDAVQHVVVVMTDCKTSKGILIKEKNVEQRLVGRVLLQDVVLNSQTVIKKNTLISQSLAKILALNSKEIYVRSPLTCTTEKSVCQLCYGLNLSQGKLVSIGEAVGVIAAQSIGEPGTQLTMRTFHTGGVGVFSEQAMKSFTAPFDGKVEFLENLSGLFVRTPHGNIVYLLKYTENQFTKPILRLKSLNFPQEFFEISQSDVPSGSILWVKQGEYVKTGQLLLQASQIKTSKQQMPESSHPVQAPFSGEVFFESMVIRVIRKQTQLKTKKLIKKEDDISPKFRTLTELGNFWILSSGIQKENSISKSFFVKGDLLSSNTPVLQYNLTIPKKGQLKRVNSNLVLGQSCFEFLVSTIYYSKIFYFLIDTDLHNQTNFIVYNNNPKKGLLIWYPSLPNFNAHQSGYCSIVWNGQEIAQPKVSEFTELTQTNECKNQKSYTQVSLFWSVHQIFNFNKATLLLKNSCFLVTNSPRTISKQGTFQVELDQKMKWAKKILFPDKIFKNSNKTSQIPLSPFLAKALKNIDNSLLRNSRKNIIQKKQGWFYIPEKEVSVIGPSQLTGVILEPSSKFENISFGKSPISVNFLQTQNVLLLKSKLKGDTNKLLSASSSCFFYSVENLLSFTNSFTTETSFINKTGILSDLFKNPFRKSATNLFIFNKQFSTEFVFYKIDNTTDKKDFLSPDTCLTFKIKRKRQLKNILFIQKNSHQIFPDLKFFKQKWLLQKTTQPHVSLKSPLFTKQVPTKFQSKQVSKSHFNVLVPFSSEWFSTQYFFKIEITLNSWFKNSQTNPQKFQSNFQFYSPTVTSVFPGFSFMFYDHLKLQNSTQFSFKTFVNGYVLPEFNITQAVLKSRSLGEFQYLQINQNSNSFSVLRTTDLTILKLPSSKVELKSLRMGTIVRWGQELFPGFAMPISGQVLKLTSKTLTIRRGTPILASARGVVHVFNKDLIEKNNLLITLKSRRLQTEDIVQGIPKIEQLFEARETQGGELIPNNAHTKLRSFFRTAIQSKPLRVAVNQSIQQIQIFLVENILEAYSNQGVTISEKHVEIVVRQMTARVRILSGGDTGLLPGEIVQLKWVERVNSRLARLGCRQASYEPMILGITKSVLQSESFLVAASFQEVSRVLVRSALAKKMDFLRGLHENVILGQLIPAGTGVISESVFDETTQFVRENSEIGQQELSTLITDVKKLTKSNASSQPKLNTESNFSNENPFS